ncbi:MAG: 50S ribosomal protein L5 [Candidatus Nealsonbacteria bacterium]|nr:50S ribosomal protein L5 [Candidatus Nealsonbacteria bacterium]
MLKFSEKYKKEVIPAMMAKFGYRSVMAVPQFKKVVVNTGFGRIVAGKGNDEQKKIQDAILQDLTTICGQKANLRVAKKSISSFKIREGQGVGASCVLRKIRMQDFLERLINIVLPRSRDFQGIDQKSLDSKGNLTFGIREHIAFPEVSPEKTKSIFGLEVTISTNAKNRAEGFELLKLIGFPIK